ncbi:hypothetical protein ATCC90586_007985 [Pythium insidiosum]|nr:hypothetical protein ATCC90586_007985 [Pythium insidiosum]
MGNVCCGVGDYEMLQRQEVLKEGATFKRKLTYLGLISKHDSVFLQLNASATRLQWRVVPGNSKVEDIAISRIGKVCIGELMVLGLNGQKVLELTAETAAERDLWSDR